MHIYLSFLTTKKSSTSTSQICFGLQELMASHGDFSIELLKKHRERIQGHTGLRDLQCYSPEIQGSI